MRHDWMSGRAGSTQREHQRDHGCPAGKQYSLPRALEQLEPLEGVEVRARRESRTAGRPGQSRHRTRRPSRRSRRGRGWRQETGSPRQRVQRSRARATCASFRAQDSVSSPGWLQMHQPLADHVADLGRLERPPRSDEATARCRRAVPRASGRRQGRADRKPGGDAPSGPGDWRSERGIRAWSDAVTRGAAPCRRTTGRCRCWSGRAGRRGTAPRSPERGSPGPPPLGGLVEAGRPVRLNRSWLLRPRRGDLARRGWRRRAGSWRSVGPRSIRSRAGSAAAAS